jgi:hypothetical protein
LQLSECVSRVYEFGVVTLPPAFVFPLPELQRGSLFSSSLPVTRHCELLEVPLMVTELSWRLLMGNRRARNHLFLVGFICEIATPNEVVPFGRIA